MQQSPTNAMTIFEETENPNKKQIIDAYVERDGNYAMESKEIISRAMRKLGYTTESIHEWKKAFIRKYFIDVIDSHQCMNLTLAQIRDIAIENMGTYHEDKVLNRIKQLNVAGNDLRSFYSLLTLSELEMIGY